MSEICILYSLTKREMTIYSVKKHIEEYFGTYTRPSHGTIHPALKRFEEERFVTVKETLSEGGKKSKFYAITEKGKKQLTKLLLSDFSDNPSVSINEINIRLISMAFLNDEQQEELKELCIKFLEVYIAQEERKLKDEYSRFDNYQQKIIQQTIASKRALIEFIKKLQ